MASSTQTAGVHDRELEVLRWRYDELRRSGFTQAHAKLLAADYEVDLHVATRLLRSGCPEDLALRILH